MLTDTQCRNAKCKLQPYKLTDGKGLYLEIKPNGVKAWRYRFKLVKAGAAKENVFAIGDYAYSPSRETAEEAKIRRDGGRFTLAEAREERAKARALGNKALIRRTTANWSASNESMRTRRHLMPWLVNGWRSRIGRR